MGVDVTTDIRNGEKFDVTAALLLYSDGRNSLATVHGVRTHDQRVEIAPGRVADGGQLRSIAQGLLESASGECTFIPERVLGHGITRTVWWSPASSRTMVFSGAALEKIGDDLNGKQAPQPPLVFAAAARTLQVFALSANERPTPDTPLMRAPYPNLYGQGRVCLGSARVPDRHGPDLIEAWEKGWNESAFSHANPTGGEAMTAHKGGLMKLWRDLLRGDAETFPTDALVDSGYTLKDLINGHVGGQG